MKNESDPGQRARIYALLGKNIEKVQSDGRMGLDGRGNMVKLDTTAQDNKVALDFIKLDPAEFMADSGRSIEAAFAQAAAEGRPIPPLDAAGSDPAIGSDDE